MKFYSYCILFLLAVLVFSCKKKDLPPTVLDTDSDFYVNGTVDGSAISLNSGKDNYYMFSSYIQDANGVYNFIADLKQRDCNNCPNSLQIKINDFRISQPGEPARTDSSFSLKKYPLTPGYRYGVQFVSIYNKADYKCFWDFGDGSKSGDANPLHYYNTQGNYNVSLKIIGTTCEQYVKNSEKIRYPATNCHILAVRDTGRSVSCSAQAPGFVPQTYFWDFGDGFTSSSPNPSHTYSIAGTRPISLRMIDANNDTIYARYNNATITNPMPCLTNYSISSVTPVENTLALSNITVTWTDATGTVYTSNNVLQPSASYFEIISVENYDNNEKGETTKKIKVRFKCNVYNGSAFKTLDNIDAVIAVSYQ